MSNWSYDTNIYYSTPEPWAKIAEAEWGESYEFDTLVVLQNRETGEIRAMHDSGCSCPTPFEDYNGIDDTTKIESVDDLLRYLLSKEYAGPSPWRFSGAEKLTREAVLAVDPEWADVVAKVHRALREDTTSR